MVGSWVGRKRKPLTNSNLIKGLSILNGGEGGIYSAHPCASPFGLPTAVKICSGQIFEPECLQSTTCPQKTKAPSTCVNEAFIFGGEGGI